jgi:hypothetical protein
MSIKAVFGVEGVHGFKFGDVGVFDEGFNVDVMFALVIYLTIFLRKR